MSGRWTTERRAYWFVLFLLLEGSAAHTFVCSYLRNQAFVYSALDLALAGAGMILFVLIVVGFRRRKELGQQGGKLPYMLEGGRDLPKLPRALENEAKWAHYLLPLGIDVQAKAKTKASNPNNLPDNLK